MALGDILWASGFDHSDASVFDLGAGNVAFDTATTRTPRSTYKYAPTGSSVASATLSGNVKEFVIGLGIQHGGTNTGWINMISPNGTANFSIAGDGTNKLRLTKGAGGTIYTGTTVLSQDPVWHWICVYVRIGDATGNAATYGKAQVYIDGVAESGLLTNLDTRNDAAAGGDTCDRFSIGGSATNQTDDVYIIDATGTTNNGDDASPGGSLALGEVTIPYLIPTSDGNYTSLTPSTGTSHFALVDEIPPSDTDYNGSATVGNKDSYGMSNLTNAASVEGVVARARAFKSDAGAKSGRIILRSSGSDQNGTDLVLSTTATLKHMWNLRKSPFTSSAWTVSEVNAIEEGYEVRT